MRAICAIYVVLHHAWVDTWNIFIGEGPGILMWLLTGWLAFGHEAVTVFIAISGFCLMLPALRAGMTLPSKKRFFARRAMRILPPYYAALAFSTVVILATGHKDWITREGTIQHALLIHDFGPHIFEINAPMWSIAVETQIYLLFPMMLWFSRGISIYANLLLTGIVGYCLFEKFGLWQGFERDTHYLFILALSMYAAWFSRRASALAVRVVTVVALCSSASAVSLRLFALRATVGTALALGFSYVFYLCFERPFLQRTARGSLVANQKNQFLSHTPEAQTWTRTDRRPLVRIGEHPASSNTQSANRTRCIARLRFQL